MEVHEHSFRTTIKKNQISDQKKQGVKLPEKLPRKNGISKMLDKVLNYPKGYGPVGLGPTTDAKNK